MWLSDAKRAGLCFYVSKETIGTVSFAVSTWFTGGDERFYFGKGAFYAATKRHPFWLWIRYFAFRTRKDTQLPREQKLYWMKRGKEGYKKMQGFECFSKNLCEKGENDA